MRNNYSFLKCCISYGKYNCMSKKFPKMNVKFYSNVITNSQTNEYV